MTFREFSFKHYLTIFLAIFGNPFMMVAGLSRQEEICSAITYYPLFPVNKEDNQYAVNIASNGIVYSNLNRASSYTSKMIRGYKLSTRRIKHIQDSTTAKESMEKQINTAAIKDIKFRGLKITDEFETLTKNIHYSLTLKQEAYNSALQTQTGSNTGNCGEHSELAIATYLKDQIQTGQTKQLQRFVLILNGENGDVIDNHAFVVENSGVSSQIISNNPDHVKAVLGEVDNQVDAYLCDYHYNREQGPFGEVRQRNKVYGLESETDWTSLKIQDFNVDIDFSHFPEEAVELRQTFETINQDLNTRILEDINLPLVDTNQLTR